MKSKYFIIAIFTLIIGCSTSTTTVEETTYKISKIPNAQLFYSPDSSYSFKISPDWYALSDEINKGNEVWLINDSKTEFIKVSEIYFLPGSRSDLQNNLTLLANLSLGNKQRKYSDLKILKSPKIYRSGDLIFSDYEIKFNKEQIGRTIVFSYKSKFFEIFAYCNNETENNKIYQVFSLLQFIQRSFK